MRLVDAAEFGATAAAFAEHGEARSACSSLRRALDRRAAAGGALLGLGDRLPRTADRRVIAVLTAMVDAARTHGDPAGAGTSPGSSSTRPAQRGSAPGADRAYARAGKRGRALGQFGACRDALVAELGIEPAAETVRLHERIVAGERVFSRAIPRSHPRASLIEGGSA